MLLLVIAGGLWAFVELADEVREGSTRTFDERILLAMRSGGDQDDPVGPAWLEEIGRDLTAFGGVPALMLMVAFSGGLLYLQGKGRTAMVMVVAVGTGILASLLLKQGFSRPRPDLVSHGSVVYTLSFPSGHSMMAATTYLTLAAIFLRTQKRRLVKAYLLVAAATLALLVGVSRVYLGVHWPTDVLAGWAAGTVWACLAWIVERWLQLRGAVEQEGDSAPE